MMKSNMHPTNIYKVGANVKRKYSSAEYNNLDIYQINSTYYSALGDDDKAYLLSRAFQVFAPGIPMVYYVGLLAGSNDLNCLKRLRKVVTLTVTTTLKKKWHKKFNVQ